MIDFLRVLSISPLLLLSILLLRSRKPWPATGFAAFFCFCLIGYLLADWDSLDGTILFYFCLPFAIAVPMGFWLFSKSLFDDETKWALWVKWLLGGYVVLSIIIVLLLRTSILGVPEEGRRMLQLVQHAMALGMVVLAIIEAARNRMEDLMVRRLRLRYWFIVSTSILMCLTILTELAFYNNEAPLWLNLLQKLIILALTFTFIIQYTVINADFFQQNDQVQKPEVVKECPEVDEKLIERLKVRMEEEKAYRTEGLSIRELAGQLDVKEYKLRQTINQHLGFRNFNEFLNSYRVKEACALLSDTSKQDLTVLEIAYDLGYKSIAPFNKAFKQITGKTPTEWRKQ